MTNWPNDLQRVTRLERSVDPKVAMNADVQPDALVSVVMTTFNSEKHVTSALRSLQEQTHRNIEVIIVDDFSTDRTIDKVKSFCNDDKRFRLIPLPANNGTYWAKNTGILEAKGSVITFMDSDDFSDPSRIATQLSALSAKGAVASLCHCVRVDENGEIVLNRGREHRPAPISLMVKRQVYHDIGFFDTVRTSADVEFLSRISLTYGEEAIVTVEKPLYKALIWTGSLTNAAQNSVDLSARVGFLSPARQNYSDMYQQWHAALRAQGVTARVPFPLTNRPFKIDPMLRVADDRFDHDPVIAFMATFPPRIKSLERVISSLENQTDHIFVYLNNYEYIPDFLKKDNITAIILDSAGDLRDVGKLFSMHAAPNGYYFTVDDDIEYPNDYCESLVRVIEKYNRKAIVGVHGVIFENPLQRYFSKNRILYHFREKLKEDKFVNLIGTGTAAFHSSTFVPNYRTMPKGMLDIGVALAARKSGVPIVSVSRSAEWLKPIELQGSDEPTLYDEFKDDDHEQTRFLKQIDDWTPLEAQTGRTIADLVSSETRNIFLEKIQSSRSEVESLPCISKIKAEIETLENRRKSKIYNAQIPARPDIQIFIPSFNRHESLRELVKQIDEQSQNYKVSVAIFDDGSKEPVSLRWTDFPNLRSLSVSRSTNHGKKRYWNLVNHIFSTAEKSFADVFYYLADDVLLVPNFFKRSINAWNGIADRNKVAINLILDQREGKTCWTNYPPHLAKTVDLPVYKCQWVDMVMMFNTRMLEALSYSVHPIDEKRWQNQPLLSSGVGDQLSQRLHRQGLSMFQVTDSLILHEDRESVMNPEERLLNPIVSKTR